MICKRLYQVLVIAYKPEFHKIAYLTNSQPQAMEYPPTGKARKGEVWTNCTLECSNEKKVV